MNAPFTKGDKVTVFRSWDDKGTIYANRFTVASCGAKRMHLVCTDGTNAEFRVYVAHLNQYPRTTVIATERDDVERVFGLNMASDFNRIEREHIKECIRNSGNIGYCLHMQEKLSKLHAPEFRTDIAFGGTI